MPTAVLDIFRIMGMIRAIDPEDSAAATINGPAIERNPSTGVAGAASVVLHVACGAATGGPSAQTVDGKVQHSVDGSTGWNDLLNEAITTLTADDTDGESPGINLRDARAFIRTVVTVGFTGGTTPTIPVAATVCLGGRD